MTGRLRPLTDSEIDLWTEVARTVVARPGASIPRRAKIHEPAPEAKPKPPAERRPTAASFSPTPAPQVPSSPSALDRKYRKKVAGGRVAIDDVLDLHGMNQAQAHGALLGFLMRAQDRGARLVLVVTGKGQRERLGPDGGLEVGVLRRAVPFWLRDSAARSIVVGFEEAARPHGGEGALYIRLRRRTR